MVLFKVRFCLVFINNSTFILHNILLLCCPISFWKCNTLAVLIKLGKKLHDDTLPPVILLQGLCAYLDTTPPLLKLTGLPLKAWKLLSDCIKLLSEILNKAYKTAKEAQDHLRQLQRDDKSDGQNSAAAVDTAAEVMKTTQLDLQQALHTYKSMQILLEQRAWWQDCHLQLPKTSSKLARLVNEGAASVETLIPLAIVHSAQLHAIEFGKGTRIKLNLAEPSSIFVLDRLATVVKLLQEVGTVEDIQTMFLTASKTVRLAATVGLAVGESAVQSTALAAAFAKITADAVDGAQDIQFAADSTTLGGTLTSEIAWKPYPLGATHPEIGFLSQLPDAWWKVFPQKRREEKGATETDRNEEEGGGDDEALNNGEFLGTQQTQTQRRVRFNLPDTQVDSAKDTD